MQRVVSFLLRLIQDFSDLDGSIDYSIFGRRRGFFAAILRSCGYQDCACYIAVKIKFAYLCESIRSEKHPCLCYKGLIPATCQLELGETVNAERSKSVVPHQ